MALKNHVKHSGGDLETDIGSNVTSLKSYKTHYHDLHRLSATKGKNDTTVERIQDQKQDMERGKGIKVSG